MSRALRGKSQSQLAASEADEELAEVVVDWVTIKGRYEDHIRRRQERCKLGLSTNGHASRIKKEVVHKS